MTLSSRRVRRRHALVALLAPIAVIACGPRVRPPAPGPPPVPPARTSVPVPSELPGSTLPRELTALLPGAGRASGEEFDLRIGVAPEDFPKDLLPPGTAIGASAISDRATVVVGTNADLTTAGRAREPMRLASIGWNNVMPVRRGFTSGPGDFPLSVCRDVDFASVTFVDRPAGGSFVRVTLTKDPRRSCVPRPDLGFNFPDVPIPSLIAPPGARVTGGGGGGGNDEMYSRTVLDTAMTAQAVMAHYSAQFEAAGWKIDSRANDDNNVCVTRFAITSRIGDAVTAVVTVTALKGTTRFDLTLSVIRNLPSRGRIGGFVARP